MVFNCERGVVPVISTPPPPEAETVVVADWSAPAMTRSGLTPDGVKVGTVVLTASPDNSTASELWTMSKHLNS